MKRTPVAIAMRMKALVNSSLYYGDWDRAAREWQMSTRELRTICKKGQQYVNKKNENAQWLIGYGGGGRRQRVLEGSEPDYPFPVRNLLMLQ